MTSEQICSRVKEEAKRSNYGWIASATELVALCNKVLFSKKHAKEIKVCILNCFAELMHEPALEPYGAPSSDDLVASFHCYNTLKGTDDSTVRAVKEKFLMAIICDERSRHVNFIHGGPVFNDFCHNWKNEILKSFYKEEINFKRFRATIYKNFLEKLKEAENLGLFAEEDKECATSLSKFYLS